MGFAKKRAEGQEEAVRKILKAVGREDCEFCGEPSHNDDVDEVQAFKYASSCFAKGTDFCKCFGSQEELTDAIKEELAHGSLCSCGSS